MEMEHTRRSSILDQLETHLNDIQKLKDDLQINLNNCTANLQEHCLEIRTDIHLATESVISKIHFLNETLIDQVNSYEKQTIQHIYDNQKTKDKFQQTINELDQFIMNALDQTKNHQFLLKSSLKLKEHAIETGQSIQAFTFNSNKISFCQSNASDDLIGTNKFEALASLRLEMCLDLNVLLHEKVVESIEIDLRDESNYYILYLTDDHILNSKLVNIKTLSIYSSNEYRNVNKFKKFKEIIVTHSFSRSGHSLDILNLDLEQLYSIKSESDVLFLAANENYIYSTYKESNHVILRVFSRDMKYLSHDILTDDQGMLQFEISNGNVFLLSTSCLSIFNENTGRLVKSIQIFTEKFLIDSKRNLLLYNLSTEKLNYFTSGGDLLKEIGIIGPQCFHPVIFLNTSDCLTILDECFNRKKVFKNSRAIINE